MHCATSGARGFDVAGFLRILRVLEIVLGTCLALAVLMASNENWGIIYIVFIFACINAPLVLVGLWALVFRPALRRLAVWVVLLPAAFLVIPVFARTAMGNPLDARLLLFAGLAAVASALLLALARPGRVAVRLPSSLFRSKVWNVLLLAPLVTGWLLAVTAIIRTGPALLDTSSGQGSPGMGSAMMLIMTTVWLGGLALLSLFIATWAWLGLFGSVVGVQRKLHVAQLALAGPGLLIGVLFLLWLAGPG